MGVKVVTDFTGFKTSIKNNPFNYLILLNIISVCPVTKKNEGFVKTLELQSALQSDLDCLIENPP